MIRDRSREDEIALGLTPNLATPPFALCLATCRGSESQSFQVDGPAGEVGTDGHRLPSYNDLCGDGHYRREPCAHRILPSPPGGSTAAPPRSFSTTSSSPTTAPSAARGRC